MKGHAQPPTPMPLKTMPLARPRRWTHQLSEGEGGGGEGRTGKGAAQLSVL